jgi:uncharacterized membrane protein YfcA
MQMQEVLLLILIGALAGLIAGLLGVGGGIVIIPALIFIFGFSQHMAQGTSLALMLPPIGLFAALRYWKAGQVHWQFAFILSISFMISAYLGSVIAVQLPEKIIKKIFGFMMLAVALKIIFSKH